MCGIAGIWNRSGASVDRLALERMAQILVNRGTVLLNYRLGDIAARIGTPCNLLGFQISQRAAHEFAVTAVMREGSDREAFRAGVERRFAERFGAATQTRVRFVDDLPRTPGGKVRTVVSSAGVRRPPSVDV